MKDPFLVFPDLETERLELEQVTLNDLEAMYEIKSNPEVTHQYCREPHTSMIQTESWIRILLDDYRERKTLFWKIVEKGEDRIAGSITLWNLDLGSSVAEVGYELHPDFWKKGIMRESLDCVLRWTFENFGLNRVEACPIQGNSSSAGLLERAGFKLEGTLRERVFFGGRFLDQYYYALLRKDWIRMKIQQKF